MCLLALLTSPAAASQVDLKATLFKAEDDAKRQKASGSAAPRSKVSLSALPLLFPALGYVIR